jgi:hypothetical protein
MSLYRFEILEGDLTDTVQVECHDLAEVRAEALRLAAGCIKDLRTDFWERPYWIVRITDDKNMTVLSLTFAAD